jgi:hypothetical protein
MNRVPNLDKSLDKKSGFTFVELLMFLAVTGLLLAGMFIGTGANLARERYNDGVSGIEEFLAEQFMLVQNPERPTNNTNNQACVAFNAAGNPLAHIDGTPDIHHADTAYLGINNLPGEFRGRSDCLIYGRMIEFFVENGQQHIRATTVVGRDLEDYAIKNHDIDYRARLLTLNDLDLLAVARLGRANDSVTFIPDWGTTVAGFIRTDGAIQHRDNIQDPAEGAILIVRMPISGSVRTFITTSSDARSIPNLSFNIPTQVSFISGAGSTHSRFFCILPDGSGIWTPTLRVIRVQQNVGNISAVSTLPTDFAADDEGVLIQCRQ